MRNGLSIEPFVADRNTHARVLVVVLNWNGWRDTLDCLASLENLDYSNYGVVVVDNGSTDESAARIRAAYPHIDLLETNANLGFAGGSNLGIRYALSREAEYVWLLNNDTIVDPKALEAMVHKGVSDPTVGVVGSVLRYYDEPDRIQVYGGGRVSLWTGVSRHFIVSVADDDLHYVSGASLLINRLLIEDVGLLDESYFFYWEDIDYCQRALRRGWKLSVAGESSVLHREGGTISEGKDKSIASDEFDVRSMVLFLHSHAGFRWPLAVLLRLCGVVVNRLYRRQGDRILPLLKIAWKTVGEVLAG